MPAKVRKAPTTKDSFWVSPRSGTNDFHSKAMFDSPPRPTCHIASPKMKRIGMIRPKIVQISATRPLVFIPKRLVIVIDQKRALIDRKMNHRLSFSSGSNPYVAATTITVRIEGNQMTFSIHCCQTATKPRRSPNAVFTQT